MKNDLLMNFSADRENNKIKVERAFAAPVSNVWAAWTQPELLDQWWAPKPWKARTKSMEFKTGGHRLYAMVGPDGSEHWARADYSAVDPENSFSYMDAFCDAEGKLNEGFPRSNWKNDFKQTGETTTVNIEISYNTLADMEQFLAMGFKEGFLAAMGNLDEIFAS